MSQDRIENNAQEKRRAGFSLVELMLVVALIGVLSVIAIPAYKTYQYRARRSEAYTNLASLAKSQKAYFAEWSDYIDSLPQPPGAPTELKRDYLPVEAAFSIVGWAPESDVFFSYESCSDGFLGTVCACCPTCFTAGAWGDLDGDSTIGGLLYVSAPMGTAAADTCPMTMFGGSVPTNVNTGLPSLNMVVVASSASDF